MSTVGPNIYKSFITDMNDLKIGGLINDWVPVSYDWRLSLDDILQNGIKEWVKQLADTSKTGKVTLIAHSNGGLLAKALLLELRDIGLEYLIDTLILVAVPQVGTPQAIGALLHGFGQGIPEQAPFLAPPYLMRLLGQNMPGAYGLLPSSMYFDSVTDPVVVFDKTMPSPWRTIASSLILASFLEGADRRKQPQTTDLSLPTILNPYLLSQAKDMHDRIDTWVPPLSMNIFQIAGWGIETVKAIQYSQSIKKGKRVTQYQPLFTTEGDQTVVVPSALNMPTSTPNIKRFWLDLADINHFKIIKRSHADILEVPDLRNAIKNIITNSTDGVSSTLGTTSPPIKNGKKLQFFLHSDTLAMDMYDGQGNHTGISTTTGEKEENIPDTTYGLFGNVVYISIPEDTVITLNTASRAHSGQPSSVRVLIHNPATQSADMSTRQSPENDDTYTLDIVEMDQGEVSASTSFTDIPVASTTVSTIPVPESFIELAPIKVDTNDDGLVDFEVKPGEIVPYIEPVSINTPVRSIGGSRSGGRAHVTTTSNTVRTDILVQNAEPAVLLYINKKPNTELSTTTKVQEITKPIATPTQTAAVFSALPENEITAWFTRLITKVKLLWSYIKNSLY